MCVYLYQIKRKTLTIMTASKKQTVRIFGETVTVGTKRHFKLSEQLRIMNQTSSIER